MNIVIDISQIECMNFVFLEKKKNNIVDGYFTKIIYSDPFITFHNIYINFPIHYNYVDKIVVKNNFFFNTSQNMELIKNITYLEEQIIEYYKKEFHIQKKNNLSLFNQLKSGRIKIYKEYNDEIRHDERTSIILKISGIWETNNDIGIAFKFLEMYDVR